MGGYEPINCPNCGRFMEWDAYDGEFTCSCDGSESIKDPDREGWLTIRKKSDHSVHEYRKAVTGHSWRGDRDELLKRLDELEDEVKNDPEVQKFREKIEREMGTLSHEDLHHKVFRTLHLTAVIRREE